MARSPENLCTPRFEWYAGPFCHQRSIGSATPVGAGIQAWVLSQGNATGLLVYVLTVSLRDMKTASGFCIEPFQAAGQEAGQGMNCSRRLLTSYQSVMLLVENGVLIVGSHRGGQYQKCLDGTLNSERMM